VDATPLLGEVARRLNDVHLEAVLIGNAGAALQGAPVTTIDFDFLYRKTPRNLAKLKRVTDALKATILRPYYPSSEMYRIVRDDDGLQVDFRSTVHGIRSFAGARDRATQMEIAGATVLVAALSDIIASKRAARRAIWRCSTYWRRHVQRKRRSRRSRLDALARESERHLRELIERWQRLPPERRTNFLRKRIAPGRSAL